MCNDTMALVYRGLPNNLLTCGLWSTLAMMNYYNRIVDPPPHPHAGGQLGRFASLGLSVSNATYPYEAVDAVSTSMGVLEK